LFNKLQTNKEMHTVPRY